MSRAAGNLYVAWQGVRRRPFRNLLTATSLLVGVLAVMLIQGGGESVREAIVRDSVLQYGPATTLQVSMAASADSAGAVTQWKDLLSRGTADKRGRVTVVMESAAVGVRVSGVTATDLTIRMVEPELRALRPFPVVEGGWLTGEPAIAPVVVVNTAAWQRLPWRDGDAELLVGTSQQRLRVRVVGVVYDGTNQPAMYVDMPGAETWSAAVWDSASVSLYVHSPELGEAALTERVRNLATLSGRSAEISGVQRVDRLDQFVDQVDTSRRIFLAIAGLSLLVGSLGILNIGLATLRERADELSLRRSFGATRSDVVRIMILESQFVAAGAAGAAALIAAVVLPLALRAAGPDYPLGTPTLPVAAMATGLVASCASALVGALAPTIRAARVPIASIMRV